MVTEKGFRMAKVVALVSLLILSAYEVAYYGREVKWSMGVDTKGGDAQGGDFSKIQANTDTVIAYCQSSNGYMRGGLYAFSLDGKQKWVFNDMGGYGISSPTLAGNGTVYFGGTLPNDSTPSLIALNNDGSVAWKYSVTNGTFSEITIGPEGNVYANHDIYDGQNYSSADFMAFSPEGKLIWKHESKMFSPISVSPNGTIVISSDDNLTGYSPDGTVIWNAPGMSMPSYALLINDTIYFTSNYGGYEGDHVGIRADLMAMSLNGSVLWRYPDFFATTTNNMADMICYSQVVVDDRGDLLFVRSNYTSADGYISLLAVGQDGELRWEYKDSSMALPSTYGDRIVVSTDSGLIVLDLDGHVLWKVDLKGAYEPVAFGPDGTMYVSTYGKLFAIGKNPIILEVGLAILLPVIAVCSIVLWRRRKG